MSRLGSIHPFRHQKRVVGVEKCMVGFEKRVVGLKNGRLVGG
jgi:hypothetical protein